MILCDEAPVLGGRLLAEVEEVGGQPGHLWAADVAAELGAMPNVRVMTRTTVTGAFDQGTYGAVEEVAGGAPTPEQPVSCFWRIVAERAILCAGSLERPIAFPDNDRPGIMMAGAARAYRLWRVSCLKSGRHPTRFCP